MSAKMTTTLKKGITGEFICTLTHFSGTNSPKPAGPSTVIACWYADAEEKAAGRTLIEPFGLQIPAEEFLVDKNPYKVAYEYLQQPGRMLEGSVLC